MAAAIVAVAIPSADAGWRFAVMAVAVGLFAAISLDQIALAGVALLASLIYNGFLEDRFGQLAWHGSGDLRRLLLLVTVSAWGLALGESVRFAANVRARSVEIRGLPPPDGAPRDAISRRRRVRGQKAARDRFNSLNSGTAASRRTAS